MRFAKNYEGIVYHGVHGKVIVLSLQLHSMLVTSANLRVALQEQFLIVADPVKHLQTDHTADQCNDSHDM